MAFLSASTLAKVHGCTWEQNLHKKCRDTKGQSGCNHSAVHSFHQSVGRFSGSKLSRSTLNVGPGVRLSIVSKECIGAAVVLGVDIRKFSKISGMQYLIEKLLGIVSFICRVLSGKVRNGLRLQFFTESSQLALSENKKLSLKSQSVSCRKM